MVVISKEDFEQVEVMVQGKPSLKRVMSNLAFGSPNVSFIGGVEANQLGSGFELKPNPIEVKLKPKKEGLKSRDRDSEDNREDRQDPRGRERRISRRSESDMFTAKQIHMLMSRWSRPSYPNAETS